MKRCVTCHEMKEPGAFGLRRASADGLQPRCRECFRDWYQRNAARAREAIERRQAAVRKDNRERLAHYLGAHPCIDCGEADIRVLDFDHRDAAEKRCNVARMLGGGVSWESIVAEISKCDVRCANCHRRRTSERGQWWKQQVHERIAAERREEAAGRLRRMCQASA